MSTEPMMADTESEVTASGEPVMSVCRCGRAVETPCERASCDDCETEYCVDDMVLVQRPRGADYYRCERCNERMGEDLDGRLWAQVDMTQFAGND